MRRWGYLTGMLMFYGAVPALAQSVESSGAPARGPNDEVARGLFQAGRSAYQAGNYSDALSLFEQAYERSKRVELLYNVGQAADRLRQDEKAIEAFTKYLEQTPDAPNRVGVDQRLQALLEARRARQKRERQLEPPSPPTRPTAPTPEQAAERAPFATAQPDVLVESTTPKEGMPANEPLTKKWWFWTAVGAVVVASAAATLALTLGGTETVQESPYRGNVSTLRAP